LVTAGAAVKTREVARTDAEAATERVLRRREVRRFIEIRFLKVSGPNNAW
jgi:hypothetical protein